MDSEVSCDGFHGFRYITGIVARVREGAISEQRIDESVHRILRLKAQHELLEMDISGTDIEQRIKTAEQTVGSAAHHQVESYIASKAVTLLKDDNVLPLSGKGSRMVIIGRTDSDNTPICHAVSQLISGGFIDADTRIENRIDGKISGSENSSTSIVIDRYNDGKSLVYSNSLTRAIKNADVVVCLSTVGTGIKSLQDNSSTIMGISRALSDAHKFGAKFVLLSDNLPVDAARFQNADAIVCAYLSAGFGVDPTVRISGSDSVGAFNANVPAAICAIFGATDMTGTLPINIPRLEKNSDGIWNYCEEILYERGYSAVDSATVDISEHFVQ